MEPDKLRDIRNFLRLNQGEAAWLFGVDRRTWRRWEGKGGIPEPVARLVFLALKYAEVREELQKLAQDGWPTDENSELPDPDHK